MSKDGVPNPQAFPLATGSHVYCEGMTLRDWFAGQALASFTARRAPEEEARKAYAIADAMLRARLPAAALAAIDGEGE